MCQATVMESAVAASWPTVELEIFDLSAFLLCDALRIKETRDIRGPDWGGRTRRPVTAGDVLRIAAHFKFQSKIERYH